MSAIYCIDCAAISSIIKGFRPVVAPTSFMRIGIEALNVIELSSPQEPRDVKV